MNKALRRSLSQLRDSALVAALETAFNRSAVRDTNAKAAHGFSIGDWVYHDGTDWQLADRDSSSTLAEAVVCKVNGNEFEVCTQGLVTGLSGLTGGSIYWLASTAGTIQATEPTSGIRQRVGKAVSTTAFRVQFDGHDAPEQSGFPVGMISPYGGSAAPTGWLILQGETIGNASSGADYADAIYEDLFNVVKSIVPNAGTEVFGNGDTVTLPDLQGRVIVGFNSADTDFDALGETSGAKTVTLGTGEIPSHNHSVSDSGHSHSVTDGGHSHGVTDGGHSHGINHDPTAEDGAVKDRIGTGASTGSYTTASATTGVTVDSASTGVSVNSASASISESNVGGGGAHANVQPSIAFNYIIKY